MQKVPLPKPVNRSSQKIIGRASALRIAYTPPFMLKHFYSGALLPAPPRKLRSVKTTAVALCLFAVADATAVGLGELEARSYLGEPVNLRIGIITLDREEIDASCFTVVNTARGETSILRKDVQLTLVDKPGSRYLDVRGTNSFNEPIGSISIRAACKGDSGVVRDFVILLDPAPILPRAGAANVAARSVADGLPTNPLGPDTRAAQTAVATDGSTGRWTVYSGDSLRSLARGIFPNSSARQAQYIAALRQLNPELSGIADATPLYPNSQLVLPDLKAFSARSPRAAARGTASSVIATDTAPSGKEPSAAAEPVAPRVRRPRATDARPQGTPPAARDARSAPEAKPSSPKPVASKSRTDAPRDGFSLRISGGEMDLSRSQGVTEEVRAGLRERLALLDADDQTAQFLALRNTVKQFEKRLNDIQLKLDRPSLQGANGSATTATPATPVTDAAKSAPVAEVKPPVIQPPMPASTPPKAATSVNQKRETDAANWFDATLFNLPVTWLIGGIAALAGFCLAALMFLRRRPQKSGSPDANAATRTVAAPDAFNKWVNEAPAQPKATVKKPPPEPAPKAEPDDSKMSVAERSAALLTGARRPKSAELAAFVEATKADGAPVIASTASEAASAEAKARTAFDPTTTLILPGVAALKVAETESSSKQAAALSGGFELDITPTPPPGETETESDRTAEDRMRRLRYMQERYPELGARTVSIDDPDSVINAARLYYEENQLGRACELLTYAVEERPQETRYWLAQFELFRLEKMVPQFTDLAGKYHLLFGQEATWPKVRHVGYGLDPANPLFAASSSATDAEKFDPTAENWLNAPASNASNSPSMSDALVADLRSALFRQHAITQNDFVGVISRIAARA